MESRVKVLIGAVALLGALVAIVLITRPGDDASGEKPVIEAPGGEPPTELEVEDVIEGEGPEAKEGDSLSVEYVGVLYDTGAEFDSNFGTGAPFNVVLGAGSVIPGWEQGLIGAQVGDRRQLTIPSDLAYGPQGQPPDIPPDAALIFQIDIVAIN